MLELGVIALTFGLIFVGELPDKSAIAGLVLSTRYPWRWVFAGVAAAFLVHVVIAVAAGSILGLLPHNVVEGITAGLFALGAVLIWREGNEDADDVVAEEEAAIAEEAGIGFAKVSGLSFGVIFIAEWGDLTQIMTANLAAKYDDPLSVAVGATAALWTVALLAILGGRTLLATIPMKAITRIAAAVMAALATYTAVGVLL